MLAGSVAATENVEGRLRLETGRSETLALSTCTSILRPRAGRTITSKGAKLPAEGILSSVSACELRWRNEQATSSAPRRPRKHYGGGRGLATHDPEREFLFSRRGTSRSISTCSPAPG